MEQSLILKTRRKQIHHLSNLINKNGNSNTLREYKNTITLNQIQFLLELYWAMLLYTEATPGVASNSDKLLKEPTIYGIYMTNTL